MWCTKADLDANLFHALLAESEKLLRLGDANVKKIGCYALPVLLFEYFCKVVFVDVEVRTQLV